MARQQLVKTSELEGMYRAAGMPDLHPGRGYPIGAAFYTRDRIYPALVGNDIGCGMSLWQTSAKVAKVNQDKLAKRLVQVEAPLDDSWSDIIASLKAEKAIHNDGFDHALGTIGGGNHFAEFQAIEEVYDHQTLAALGINKNSCSCWYIPVPEGWDSPSWLNISRNLTTMACQQRALIVSIICSSTMKRCAGQS